ncbi:MAG: carbon storage regulator [Planctomycetes bacterium]|nr:carbon storage regulator [Planctomycetota bacterium]
MLILARKAGEKLVIDGDIVITVLEVARGGQVRLGIDAPRRHRVLRGELLDEVSAENRGAAIRSGEVPDLGGFLNVLPRTDDKA